MPPLHPTAIISEQAQIGEDCQIGPYCCIGDHVRLGRGCILHSHVVIDGHTTLGESCEVFPFASLGKQTQDLKFKGEISYVEIGGGTVIREYVTVNAATAGKNKTIIGSNCLIQAYCHIAHECILGDHVIMSSGAMLSGHIQVGNHAVIGGMAGVVQFVRIGEYAMVGAYSKLVQDIPPFCLADGIPAAIHTINKIAMERKGKSAEEIARVKQAYRILFRSDLPLDSALAQLRERYPDCPNIRSMVTFIEHSEKGLARKTR